MAMAYLNNDELEELALKGFIDHITDMQPDDRKAAIKELPDMEVQILAEFALLYEAYEVCGTVRDVLAGN